VGLNRTENFGIEYKKPTYGSWDLLPAFVTMFCLREPSWKT